MPILDWIFYEAFLKVIFREYLMNLRWKKFLLLPRSSIRYLHSPPSLRPAEFVLCIAKRRNEREKERGREEIGGTVWKPFVAAAIIPVNATDDNYWIISCINILPFSRPSRASHKRRPPFIGAWIPPPLLLLPSIMHIRVRLRLYYYNRAHTGLH